MGRTEEFAWAIWSPFQGVFVWTLRPKRTQAIAEFESAAGKPWRRYREDGFRAVRVSVRVLASYMRKDRP
jgi:hypothetical protein